MKRLFRRLMRWIYADGVEAITDHLVEEELRRRFPEGFRISPREDQLIPQDVYVAVLQHLPNPAEIIHDEWLSHTNVRNVRTFTVQMASRDVQLEMTAERIKLAPELRSPVICNGRYAHFLDVEIRGWGQTFSGQTRLRDAIRADAVSAAGRRCQWTSSVLAVSGRESQNPSPFHGRRTGRHRSWIFKHLITPWQSSFV